MANLGPTLETARLTLRAPDRSDWPAWARHEADPEVKRHASFILTEREAWGDLLACAGSWHVNGFGRFSVIENAPGMWIGRIGPSWPFGWPCGEVGWSLDPSTQGNGYALEAAVACMDYACDVIGWDKVMHTIRPAELAYQRVAARLGSTCKGPIALPAPYGDVPNEEWSQTRSEWQVNRIRLV